jgi:hypothetical protein
MSFVKMAVPLKADTLALPVTQRLRKFLGLAPRHKLMLVQTWLLLGCYRLRIILFPLKRITASLHHSDQANPPPLLTPAQQGEAVMIGRLVAAAARFTPWQSRCLTQVLVAQRLLAKRKIPGSFYLGVLRGCGATGDSTGFSAHAWLQCGNVVVNGAAEYQRFTVVSNFSWGGPHG